MITRRGISDVEGSVSRAGGNNHLIADNLGFFEDDWTLEDMLRARGDSVETLDDDNLAEGVDADLLKRLVEGRRDK